MEAESEEFGEDSPVLQAEASGVVKKLLSGVTSRMVEPIFGGCGLITGI